jgi:hypothetical protein
VIRSAKQENAGEALMLSRGKLVEDWRQRLAAAESEAAEQHRLSWLYRLRARLYRFLLSCYPQGDWRADATPIPTDETRDDVARGDTTTLLDCPLVGKPAKHAGEIQSVLKTVSAAQDHPAQSGPLLGGIATDEWVVAVSVRDRLKMAGCDELLRQSGIVVKWTLLGEIRVRHFDLERATKIIRYHREALRIKAVRPMPWLPVILHPASIPLTNWSIRLGILIFFIAPLGAILGLFGTQLVVAIPSPDPRLLFGPEVTLCLAIWYFAIVLLSLLNMLLKDLARRSEERREARSLIEEGNFRRWVDSGHGRSRGATPGGDK